MTDCIPCSERPASPCRSKAFTPAELITAAIRKQATASHALAPFKNLHAGHRGFVMCTGPSLGQQDLSWLKDEIVLGINFAHKITRALPVPWIPTYMVTADQNVLERLDDEWEKLLDTAVVITDTCTEKPGYKGANLVSGPGVSLKYAPGRDAQWADARFDFDCSKPPIYVPLGFSTTAHLAIPFAFFLGLNPVYLIGADCTAAGHAYNDKGIVFDGAISAMDGYFRPAMTAIRRLIAWRGLRLINATKGGRLEELERVDLDSLKPKGQA